MPFPTSRNRQLPKIDLSDDHLKAIGRATVECARLEGLVEATVWVLADLEQAQLPPVAGVAEPVGRALTTHGSLLSWMKLIAVLIDAVIVDKEMKTE
jgi:hypothetical protein